MADKMWRSVFHTEPPDMRTTVAATAQPSSAAPPQQQQPSPLFLMSAPLTLDPNSGASSCPLALIAPRFPLQSPSQQSVGADSLATGLSSPLTSSRVSVSSVPPPLPFSQGSGGAAAISPCTHSAPVGCVACDFDVGRRLYFFFSRCRFPFLSPSPHASKHKSANFLFKSCHALCEESNLGRETKSRARGFDA